MPDTDRTYYLPAAPIYAVGRRLTAAERDALADALARVCDEFDLWFGGEIVETDADGQPLENADVTPE